MGWGLDIIVIASVSIGHAHPFHQLKSLGTWKPYLSGSISLFSAAKGRKG